MAKVGSETWDRNPAGARDEPISFFKKSSNSTCKVLLKLLHGPLGVRGDGRACHHGGVDHAVVEAAPLGLQLALFMDRRLQE